jgi:hypothetical protein
MRVVLIITVVLQTLLGGAMRAGPTAAPIAAAACSCCADVAEPCAGCGCSAVPIESDPSDSNHPLPLAKDGVGKLVVTMPARETVVTAPREAPGVPSIAGHRAVRHVHAGRSALAAWCVWRT